MSCTEYCTAFLSLYCGCFESNDGKVACCPCLGTPCLPEACASRVAKVMPKWCCVEGTLCWSCCCPLNARLLKGLVYPSGDVIRMKSMYAGPPLVERMERGGKKGRVLVRAKFRLRTSTRPFVMFETLELTPNVIKMYTNESWAESGGSKNNFNQNSAYGTAVVLD